MNGWRDYVTKGTHKKKVIVRNFDDPPPPPQTGLYIIYTLPYIVFIL